MSMTVSTRLKSKTTSTAKSIRRHVTREEDRITKNIDLSRMHLNSTLVPWATEAQLRNKSIENRDKREQKEGQRKLRSDAAIGFDGVITFGRDAQEVIKVLPIEDQDRYFLKAGQELAAFCGTELMGLEVHRDESAPHAHYLMPSHADNGESISQKLGRTGTSKMQDIAGAVFEDLGIHRGKHKEQRILDGDDLSTIINRSVKELHETLPAEIAAKQAELEKIQEDLREKAQYYIKQMERIEKAEADLKRAEEQGKETAKIAKRLEDYQRREATAIETLNGMDAKKAALTTEIESMEKALTSTQASLTKMDQDLKTRAERIYKHENDKVIGRVKLPKAEEVEVVTKSGWLSSEVKTMKVYKEHEVDQFVHNVSQALLHNSWDQARSIERNEREAAQMGVTLDKIVKANEIEKENAVYREIEGHNLKIIRGMSEIVLNGGESVRDEGLSGSPTVALTKLLNAPMIVQYGVAMYQTEDGVVAPKQAVSPTQIAAALYRTASDLERNHDWSNDFVFKPATVQIAREFERMQYEDKGQTLHAVVEKPHGHENHQDTTDLTRPDEPMVTIDRSRNRDTGLER